MSSNVINNILCECVCGCGCDCVCVSDDSALKVYIQGSHLFTERQRDKTYMMDSIHFNAIQTKEDLAQVLWVDVLPTTTISENSPVEFLVPGAGAQYINLPETQLYIKCHILLADGSKLPPANVSEVDPKARMGPVNNFLNSMWRQLDVYWNDRLVSGSSMNYPYKAYMDVLLKDGYEAKSTQLQAQMYYQDIPVYISDPDPIKGGNTSLTTRCTFFAESREVDMQGQLYVDVFQGQTSLLLNGVDLRIKLWPSTPDFSLISAAENTAYKVVIDQAVLRVCKVTVAPQVFLEHEKRLSRATAKYPYLKAVLTTRSIEKGQSSLEVDNLYQGLIPSKLCVGIVTSSSYNGNYHRNPLAFENANLKYIAAYVNGTSVPGAPFEPTFKNDGSHLIVREFLSLFKVAEKLGNDTGNNISRYAYPNGFTIYGFDIDPEGQSVMKKRTGSFKVEIRLAEGARESLTVIFYALHPELLEIDQTRRVIG
jgi:hypothetical protein